MTDKQPEYFTVVFEGRIRDVKGNPFKVESPFGKAVAVGIGDALGRQETVIELMEIAHKAKSLTDSMIDAGVEEYELCDGSTEGICDMSAAINCAINRANGA